MLYGWSRQDFLTFKRSDSEHPKEYIGLVHTKTLCKKLDMGQQSPAYLYSLSARGMEKKAGAIEIFPLL